MDGETLSVKLFTVNSASQTTDGSDERLRLSTFHIHPRVFSSD